jgi:hypothetical protein
MSAQDEYDLAVSHQAAWQRRYLAYRYRECGFTLREAGAKFGMVSQERV